MSDVYIGLLGAFLGAIISGAWGLISEVLNRRSIMLGVANAISGEISALLSIVQFRQYITVLKTAAQENSPIIVSVSQNYFRVYESNCDKIGLLPSPLNHDIAEFYTYGQSFLEDVQSFCSQGNIRDVEAYLTMAQILESLTTKGETIISSVDKLNDIIWWKNLFCKKS